MLAIDTNLIVRFLTGDHPQQFRKASTLINSEPVFVCKTVFLEVEWVLGSVFGFTQGEVAQALIDFAGLPNVRTPRRLRRHSTGWPAGWILPMRFTWPTPEGATRS
jgi:predicted nucleic acid-binding protein